MNGTILISRAKLARSPKKKRPRSRARGRSRELRTRGKDVRSRKASVIRVNQPFRRGDQPDCRKHTGR
jgi:hypothetical protein